MAKGDQDRRRWREAKQATSAVPPWLAFRYLFAQAFNRHRPQPGVQTVTKQRARQVATDIVAALGGGLMAQPRHLDGDASWITYQGAVAPLSEPQHAMLIAWLMEQHLHTDQVARYRWELKGHQLRLLLTDMRRQRGANTVGWLAHIAE